MFLSDWNFAIFFFFFGAYVQQSLPICIYTVSHFDTSFIAFDSSHYTYVIRTPLKRLSIRNIWRQLHIAYI